MYNISQIQKISNQKIKKNTAKLYFYPVPNGKTAVFGESFNDFLRQIVSEHSAEIQKIAQHKNLDTGIEAQINTNQYNLLLEM